MTGVAGRRAIRHTRHRTSRNAVTVIIRCLRRIGARAGGRPGCCSFGESGRSSGPGGRRDHPGPSYRRPGPGRAHLLCGRWSGRLWPGWHGVHLVDRMSALLAQDAKAGGRKVTVGGGIVWIGIPKDPRHRGTPNTAPEPGSIRIPPIPSSHLHDCSGSSQAEAPNQPAETAGFRPVTTFSPRRDCLRRRSSEGGQCLRDAMRHMPWRGARTSPSAILRLEGEQRYSGTRRVRR